MVKILAALGAYLIVGVMLIISTAIDCIPDWKRNWEDKNSQSGRG